MFSLEGCKQPLQQLLNRYRVVYQDSHLSLHAPQPAVQELFEELVCAPQTREGRLLGRWVQLRPGVLPLAGSVVPTPTVVVDFANYVSRLITAQHALPAEYLAAVTLSTFRLLLQLLHPSLWSVLAQHHTMCDARFIRQQRLMRRSLPSELGVERCFMQPCGIDNWSCTSAAYALHGAVATLGCFGFLPTPADQLLCVYRAVNMLYASAARAVHVAPREIGADALLPMLTLVVVHSHLPRVFTGLEYAKHLSTRELLLSELGYYFVTLEAACAYVHNASPDTFASTGLTRCAESASVADQSPASSLSPCTQRFVDGLRKGPLKARSAAAATLLDERESLSHFLHQERNVEDLIGALLI